MTKVNNFGRLWLEETIKSTLIFNNFLTENEFRPGFCDSETDILETKTTYCREDNEGTLDKTADIQLKRNTLLWSNPAPFAFL